MGDCAVGCNSIFNKNPKVVVVKSSLKVHFYLFGRWVIFYPCFVIKLSSNLHKIGPDFKVISCSSWSIRIPVWKRNWYRVVATWCLISIFISYIWKLHLLSFWGCPAYFTILTTSTDSVFSANRAVVIGEPRIRNEIFFKFWDLENWFLQRNV